MTKRVWFNVNSGEFSNSWNKGEFGDDWVDSLLSGQSHIHEGWKLIEYECKNDDSFSFYNWMQVFTSKKHLKHSK